VALPLRISSQSKEYVRIPISAYEAGSLVDPTSDAIEMAFTTGADPVANDWKTASWETDSSTTPTTYYARLAVGPGGSVTLTVGFYTVWVRVTDNPEIPVIEVPGLVEIY